MTRKFKTVIVACIVMGCVLIGCKETNDDEENVNSTFCQQEQGTTDANKNVEQKESGIEEILNMTYSELVATEKTLTLSYYEGGGSPVYAVEEYEGVYIVYPAVSDEPQMNNLAESISDEIPVKLVIRSSETEIHPGLRVGMPAEKVNNLNIAWDDIYMSSENSLYYTSFKRDENEVTAAWAIPDDMFSEWSASLNDDLPNDPSTWEDKIEMLRVSNLLYSLIYGDDLMYHHGRLAFNHWLISTYQIALGKTEDALSSLEEMCGHSVACDLSYQNDHGRHFSSISVDTQIYPEKSEDFHEFTEHTQCYYMLDRMQHPRYDCLRRDMRFLSVVEELTMYAK